MNAVGRNPELPRPALQVFPFPVCLGFALG